MQLRNNWKVLTIAVLGVVFGSSLLLAGTYAVTSYVVASAQRADTGPMSPMMNGQSSSMMNQGMMNDQGMMGSGMMDMMAMMQMGQSMMQQMAGSGVMTMRQGQKPLSLDQALEKAQEYVKSLNNPDLVLTEVMQFDNHFYFATKEKSTGGYAFESLMDKYTGTVHRAPGPNLMWNTKYGMTTMMQDMMGSGMMPMGGGMMGDMSGGMMSSMMGGPTPIEPTTDMPISPEQAKQIARQFLEKMAAAMPQMPMTQMSMPMQPSPLQGAVVGDKVRKFYGYYTLEALKDGKLASLLSINGYTGQVWHHAWNGNFVGMREVEK